MQKARGINMVKAINVWGDKFEITINGYVRAINGHVRAISGFGRLCRLNCWTHKTLNAFQRLWSLWEVT